MVKKMIAVVLTATMLFSVTACGSPGTAAPDSGSSDNNSPVESTESSVADASAAEEDQTYDPVTIQFWNSWTGSDGEVLTELVEKFKPISGILLSRWIFPLISTASSSLPWQQMPDRI